ncbi:glutathionylspermidine synthase family protein [Proteinivorax hydrogeniformans]|uniref:Glutathionylspermidine synthase family protein n=1 Tax=Proteinivorax hydrogeniformans TaxID=1826727 RepID=A0AAU8HV53_9FIRM
MVYTKAVKEFQNIIEKNRDDYIKEYQHLKSQVAESPAIYKGEPIDFLYHPLYLSDEDLEQFKSLTDSLFGILSKVIDRYLKDENFRKHFPFEPTLETLILKDPGYSVNVPMARIDVFYHGAGKFQFCELNADGSSAMVEARELQRIIGESKAVQEHKKSHKITSFELFQSWFDALLKNYREFSTSEKLPNIAIIDYIEGDTPLEFIEFKKNFEKNRCPTVIADVRELEYRDGVLYHKDFPIDCVYRRAVTWEIIENEEKSKAFIDAYLDGNVCVVGPLRSQIIHNKVIFAVLHNEEITSFLTAQERTFIKKHIPYTAHFNVEDSALVDKVRNQKDLYVLKPMDKYAALGVYIGKDCTQDEWEEVINTVAVEGYLVQKFCNLPSKELAFFKEDGLDYINFNYMVGLFCYNQSFVGPYTRSGRKNLIGAVVESYIVPNFRISN